VQEGGREITVGCDLGGIKRIMHVVAQCSDVIVLVSKNRMKMLNGTVVGQCYK